jgi:hypothetical protein
MRWPRQAVLFLCAPFLPSCVYVHSDALQKAAEQAQTEFQAVRSASSSSTYLSKHTAQLVITEQIFDALHESEISDKLDTLLALRWDGPDSLLETTATVLTDCRTSLSNAWEKKRQVQEQLASAIGELPGIQQKLTNIAEAMTAASQTEARYKATQDLLRLTLLSLVEDGDTRSTSFDSIKKLLSEKRQYTSYSFPDQNQGSLKEGAKEETVTTLLGLPTSGIPTKPPESFEDIKPWLETLRNLPTTKPPWGKLQFADPGIATTIVGLGFDFARAEELRTRAEIDTAKQELQLLDAAIARLTEIESTLSQQVDPRRESSLPTIARSVANSTETIHQTLDHLVLQFQAAEKQLLSSPASSFGELWDKRNKLRGALHTLFVLLVRNFRTRVVEVEKTNRLLDREEAMNTNRALRIAVANLQEREAAIARGFEGLVAFHQGGISSEDVSAIIGIAQTIGIGIIAGEHQ